MDVTDLLAALYQSGQSCSVPGLCVTTDSLVRCWIRIPNRDALQDRYHNRWVRERLKKISDLVIEIQEVEILGSEPSEPACSCGETGPLLLFTTFLAIEQPVRCLDCFGLVPLYRLPTHPRREEHCELLSWMHDYQACDHLQMGTTVAERANERQLGRIDSALSKSGLEVAKTLSESAGRPVYYFLSVSRARSFKAEVAKKCPSCGGEWLLPEPLHDRFDFRCDRCRLLSNIAWSVRTRISRRPSVEP